MSEVREFPARCILRHRKGQQQQTTHGFLCDDHAASLNEMLTDIEELYAVVLLDAAIPLASPAPSQGIKHLKSPEAPAPGRLDVFALSDRRNYDAGVRESGDQEWWASADIPNVAGTINSWARTVCEERELSGSTLDGSLSKGVKFLHAHREWVYQQPWVDEYARELMRLRRLLAGMLGEHPAQPIGRCPTMDDDGVQCGGPLWADTGGAERVTCGKCAVEFDERMLRHLGDMLVQAGETA